MRKLTHEVRSTESRIQSTIQETLQHVLVIKALNREEDAENKLQKLQKGLRVQVVNKAKYSITSATIMNFGFSAGYLITFIWGILNLQQGIITYGAMIAFIQLVGQIQTPVRGLTRFVPILIGAFTAADRLSEIENIPLEKHGCGKKMEGKVGIKFENVTYSYEKGSKRILDNFSFDIKPCSITAIVGETGSGKTTLVRLAISLLECNNGNILLYNDKGDKENIGTETRCNFSYVPQGNTLLSGTIRDNLLMGNPMATQEEMERVLKMAHAEFVLSMPNGLDTHCQEMGVGLSEGQAQRISIARALLKQAPILLLDEATSSLDEQTEKEVIRNIASNCDQKTLIFITHRPEVLKYATQTIKF